MREVESFNIVTETRNIGKAIVFTKEMLSSLGIEVKEERDAIIADAEKVKYEVLLVERGKATDIVIFIEYKLIDDPNQPKIIANPLIRLKGSTQFLVSKEYKAKRIINALTKVMRRLKRVEKMNTQLQRISQMQPNSLSHTALRYWEQLPGTLLSHLLQLDSVTQRCTDLDEAESSTAKTEHFPETSLPVNNNIIEGGE